MKKTIKTALLINTGSSRNLGDRAMLFNVERLLSDRGVRRIYSIYPVRPPELDPSVELKPYLPLISHLGRLSSLGVKPGSFIVTVELFMVFVGLCLLSLPALLAREGSSSQRTRNDLLAAIGDSDFVLFSGGGYLTDLGTLEARACLLTGILAILLGKPVFFSGQGIGPLRNPLTRFLLKFVTARARKILLRDQDASKRLLTEIKIDQLKIREAGDDALTLAASPKEVDEKSDTGKILGIHLRLTPFGTESGRIIDRTRAIFEPLIQEGWKLRFYMFAAQSAWESDVYGKLTDGMDGNAYSIVQSEDPLEIKHSIGECTVCVGMAYHFLLFALAEAVPSIGLYSGSYYKQKLHGLYGWYNLHEWILDQQQCSTEELLQRIRSMADERVLLSGQLAELTTRLSGRYMSEMDNLITIATETENDHK